jgi:hypothetical protein
MRYLILVNAGKDAETGKRTDADFSEEAIPERDPAYRMQDGTLHQEQTVDDLTGAMRFDLARRLQELGMSAARAAMVASL